MPVPVKVLITFDDGSTLEHTLEGISSIFVNEAAARRCNRNPPYKQGAKNTDSGSGDTLMATGGGGGGQCYYVNGMIFCP